MREHQAYAAALGWYLDQGVDEALLDAPIQRQAANAQPAVQAPLVAPILSAAPGFVTLGRSDARAEAIKLAGATTTLDELKAAIAGFEGIAIKKTATNMVFADGNPQAPVMLVGEAPGADEDRIGRPFVGASGQLLDRILGWAGMDRTQTDPAKAIYISNILNWRPPGNRTPSPAEIEVSLPFIERHIALIKPKILILCGAVAAQALLGRSESISRLRRTWHTYTPQTGEAPIAAIATYHPAYLLRTPSQKKAVWQDMLAVMEKKDDM